MTSIENIRNRLIDKILVTKDEKFLEVVENLFLTTQKESAIELSEPQIEMLRMSDEDIKEGRVISDAELEKFDQNL